MRHLPIPYHHTGRGLNVYSGTRTQGGRGLGGVLGGLFKNIIVPIGKKLLGIGVQKTAGALEDVAAGKSVKTAFKDQFVGKTTPGSVLRTGARKAADVMTDIADGHAPTEAIMRQVRKRRRLPPPQQKRRRQHSRRQRSPSPPPPRKRRKSAAAPKQRRKRRRRDIFD